LTSEAIRLVHQRSCNHGHHHPRGLAAASTHARGHAHAQAGATLAKIVETDELLRRVDALEAKHGVKPKEQA
jgi:hypothetical protein